MSDISESSQESNFSTKNYILNALPADALARLLPDLERVGLAHGAILYYQDDQINYIYFPENAMVSVVATTPHGQVAEVSVVGSEGLIGIDVLLDEGTAFNETLIQLPDGAWRIKTEIIKREFNLGGAFQKLALRFTRLLMIQISQTALCNRLHTVEERLVRWLLLCHDRAMSDELPLTQEFLAVMLGANRATVTTAAITLQGGGLIKYRYGMVTILDRRGLEQFACDCYRTVKDEYDRIQKAPLSLS